MMKRNSFLYLFTLIIFINMASKVTLSMPLTDMPAEQSLKKRAINHSMDDFMDLVQAFNNLTNNLTNVYTMEKDGLSSAKLNQPFWSYHSLPLYKGGTANRFNHDEFNNQESWEQRYQSYLRNPVDSFLKNGSTDKLSPLEKYELLIGDKNYALTMREWDKGKEYINRIGVIPTWIGACHGTAPASFSHSRPAKSISVLSADKKTSVVFYPSDIKALLAFAWTTNGGPSAVMGSRCQFYKNKMTKSCNDTNPGSFHLALTNLIGIHKNPLIIDSDSGPQVWNRPVIGYRFAYFNPIFRNYTRRLSNAIIDIEKYPNDPFKQLRATGTKKIVGVRAEIELIGETLASSELTDNTSHDKTFKLVFTYDLELNQFGEILGGMWHQSNFPDFVWVVSPENLPLSNSERWMPRLATVNSRQAQLPEALVEIARESRKDNQVSFWAIDYLLRKSSQD